MGHQEPCFANSLNGSNKRYGVRCGSRKSRASVLTPAASEVPLEQGGGRALRPEHVARADVSRDAEPLVRAVGEGQCSCDGLHDEVQAKVCHGRVVQAHRLID